MNREVKFIVVHCSATPASMDIGRAEIDQWHRDKGWKMIGYHRVIRRSGWIEDGRPLDEDHVLEPNEIGAHVEGYNSQSVGVCMVGGVKKNAAGQLIAENNFTPEQFRSLRLILRKLQAQFPTARIVGHRDLNPGKACPSFSVRDFLARTGAEVPWA